MREIAEFLADASRRGRRIVVLCHHNADPDAVGSSLALADALTQLGAKVRAGVSEGLSRASRSVLSAVGREIEVDPPLDSDIVVLVDTSSLEHLGRLGEEVRRRSPDIVVIDHHRPVEEMGGMAKFYLVREEVAAAGELVLELMDELGVKPTPETAFLLLAGIVSDTGQFRLADATTFNAVNALITAGADYHRVLNSLALPEDISKRVAMLKAAQRLELHTIHGRHVALSELSSFEADAAAMLLRIGADVAIVGSKEKGTIRLSARAREESLVGTKLHLGDLMTELSKCFEGTGGGHAGAASMTGKGELAEAKRQALGILRRMLESK